MYWNLTFYVEIKTARFLYSAGEIIDYFIARISEGVIEQLKTRKSNSTHEVVFEAKAIPGLGFKSYFIKKSASNDIHTKTNSRVEMKKSNYEDVVVIENEVDFFSFRSYKYCM